MSASPVIVDVSNVTMRYPEVIALRAVSLKVRQGEVVGLLGPNGAGKTTLLELIEGVRTPTAGRIALLGCDPCDTAGSRGQVGVVFQRCSMPRYVTVERVIELCRAMFPGYAHGAQLVTRLGLGHLRSRLVGDLSAGQQQRLGVLVALYGGRAVVLLDEPTSALDVRSRRAVWDTILDLKRNGLTGIVATHDMAEASELCDRIVFIQHGQIIADRPTGQASTTQAAAEYSFRLTLPASAVDTVRQWPFVNGLRAEGGSWGFSCALSDVGAATEAIAALERQFGFDGNLVIRQSSLEAAYLEIIEQVD